MNKVLKVIHSRKSTHGNFTDKEISQSDLDSILSASVSAPNAGNAQNYAIIVVDDKDTMHKVSGYTADKMLVYCVDFQRNMEMAASLGLSHTIDPVWALMTGVADAAIAAQTAVIAAQSLGIDSLISNGVQKGNPQRVWELLKLPEKNCFPVLAVYLGYADRSTSHKSGRLGEPGVIHRGEYKPRSKEDIKNILDFTDSAEYGPPEIWKEKGFSHYLEMFFKGPGLRAGTMYGNLATVLADAGFKITKTE